ncbi:branched-chain amino acid ABC transporter substrate-binding protein [Chromobacterium sp. LK11]|uniref:ABC transporter substrate-binding protein n=1 Tax=Chromobacterium sp. LK11 TaxID=1628212 RepID=UPI0006546ED7|nr:ABC transporter substrate-binding protein [Chromobacterium sp. LK11]KMN81239.1 branched-chain amino acid ABC transporter substrate-binding protein [Chromobacterium sp. LK11]
MKQTRLNAALAAVLASAGMSVAAADFKVGVQLSLTGPLALAGNEMYHGVQTAADVFARRYPQHKIQLVVVDDESTPAKAVAAVEKLAEQKVTAMVGGVISNITGPASEAANKAGIPFVTSGGTSDDMVGRGLKSFFRISNTPGYARGMSGLLGSLGVKSASIVYSSRDATSDLAAKLKAKLAAAGIATVMHPFDPAVKDFKPIVNKIKLRDRSEAMVMIAYENDYVGILRAARVLKPPLKAVVGAWALATPKMAAAFPDLTPNVFGATVLPTQIGNNPQAQEFEQAYRQRYKSSASYHAQTSYAISRLLFDALARTEQAGTLSKNGALAAELHRAGAEATLLGPVRFDERGDNPNYTAHMGQFRANGDIDIVWPAAYATAKPSYPALPW